VHDETRGDTEATSIGKTHTRARARARTHTHSAARMERSAIRLGKISRRAREWIDRVMMVAARGRATIKPSMQSHHTSLFHRLRVLRPAGSAIVRRHGNAFNERTKGNVQCVVRNDDEARGECQHSFDSKLVQHRPVTAAVSSGHVCRRWRLCMVLAYCDAYGPSSSSAVSARTRSPTDRACFSLSQSAESARMSGLITGPLYGLWPRPFVVNYSFAMLHRRIDDFFYAESVGRGDGPSCI